MDRLKFRVWDVVENGYSTDCFAVDIDGHLMMEDDYGEWNYVKKDRFIVEWCTGLPDCSGSLIFAGDVLRDSRLHGKTCVVSYDNDNCRWICSSADPEDKIGLTVYRRSEIEIIGNIHQQKGL